MHPPCDEDKLLLFCNGQLFISTLCMFLQQSWYWETVRSWSRAGIYLIVGQVPPTAGTWVVQTVETLLRQVLAPLWSRHFLHISQIPFAQSAWAWNWEVLLAASIWMHHGATCFQSPPFCLLFGLSFQNMFLLSIIGVEQAYMTVWHQLFHGERVRGKEAMFPAIHCLIFHQSYLLLRACLYAVNGLCLGTSAVLGQQDRIWCAERHGEGMHAAVLALQRFFKLKKPSLCPPLQGRPLLL